MLKKKTSIKRRLIQWSFFSSLWIFLIGLLILFWFIWDAPDLGSMEHFNHQPSVVVKDQEGNILASYGDLFGRPVALEELPPYLIQAILVVEDKRFYQHFGIDLKGIMRAFIANRKAGSTVQGGSTITQQLAKTLLIASGKIKFSDRSYRRKIQEAFLALQLERKFTKKQILTLYLNRVYLGSGTYGIDAAARKFFHKPASQLTVFESAIIAGLLKAPSRFSPLNESQKFLERSKTVLHLMEEEGYIKDAEQYMKEQTTIKPAKSGSFYFTDHVMDSLEFYVDRSEDVEITTSLDPKMQEAAERAVEKVMSEMGGKMKAEQAAFIVMTQDGAIKAMVGGRKHSTSPYNRATQAMRQPGSAIKTFIYLAALEYLGKSIYDTISDLPFERGSWKPSNFKWKSRGEITLLTALTHSVNAPSIRLTEMVGTKYLKQMLTNLGIYSDMPDDLTISLGTGQVTLIDLTSAYGCFANQGLLVNPYSILSIKNKDNKVLYKYRPFPTPRIFSKRSCKEMNIALQNIVQEGSGRSANMGDGTMFGKTGTNGGHNKGNRDAWFIGFRKTGEGKALVFGAWTGNDRGEEMSRESMGGRIPAAIVKEFFRAMK